MFYQISSKIYITAYFKRFQMVIVLNSKTLLLCHKVRKYFFLIVALQRTNNRKIW